MYLARTCSSPFVSYSQRIVSRVSGISQFHCPYFYNNGIASIRSLGSFLLLTSRITSIMKREILIRSFARIVPAIIPLISSFSSLRQFWKSLDSYRISSWISSCGAICPLWFVSDFNLLVRLFIHFIHFDGWKVVSLFYQRPDVAW